MIVLLAAGALAVAPTPMPAKTHLVRAMSALHAEYRAHPRATPTVADLNARDRRLRAQAWKQDVPARSAPARALSLDVADTRIRMCALDTGYRITCVITNERTGTLRITHARGAKLTPHRAAR